MRDRCVAEGRAFHFKQWGEHVPDDNGVKLWTAYGPGQGFPMRRVGKKAAGRLLDGRTWDEFPEAVRAL